LPIERPFRSDRGTSFGRNAVFYIEGGFPLKDALQLINRHGGKIWLFASLGEGFLAVLWAMGLIAVWLIVTPSPEMVHKVFAAVYFPDHPESLLGQIRSDILGASPRTVFLLATMALFFAGIILFSVTGMMGLIRQAAVEDRLSFGDFFSFGFRYLIQVFGLVLILIGTALSLGWLFLRLDTLVESRNVYRIALWGMGGLVGLYLLAYFSFTPMVMLVERTGIVRTLGYAFRLLWKWPAKTVFTLLNALMSAVLGVVLLGFISAFPWLVLQFFQNGIIATMVGSFFGLLMIFTFHAFPVTLYLGTLILAYVEMREELFPEDAEEESLLTGGRVI
jgi:hypothetical protein